MKLEQMIREIHAELCGEKEELCEMPNPNGIGVSFSEGSVNFYDGEKIVNYDPFTDLHTKRNLMDEALILKDYINLMIERTTGGTLEKVTISDDAITYHYKRGEK
jgi:hypothetical protein